MTKQRAETRAAVDTNVLIYALRGERVGDKTKRDLRRRAKILLEVLDDEGCTIVVPTVCVAELLLGVQPDKRGAFLAELSRRFVCPTLDMQAASIAADLWAAHRKLPATDQLRRSTLKADALIIASARTAGATRFFSHDAKCRRLAEKAGMTGCDLPTHHPNMFRDQELRCDPERIDAS